MDFKNIPRTYTLGFILLTVVVLIVALFLEPGSLVYKDKTNYEALRKQAELENKQYSELLASVQPNYQASQQFLKKIASEDLVKAEVEAALKPNQPLVIPPVAASDIKLATTDNRDAAVNYLNDIGSMIGNYNNDVTPQLATVFSDNPDVASLKAAEIRTRNLITNIRGLPVPASSLEIHKAELATYEKYAQFLSTANAYAGGVEPDPWADVYGQYAVIDNRLGVVRSEMNKLQQRYAFTEQDFNPDGFVFVKSAQAQWTVVDIWNSAWEGIKIGLGKSFATFTLKMLDKLVGHIEKNFAIASQLYYSQDLGRYYSVEYMKKFVDDPLDQSIIQQFLPQYFCIPKNKEELKKIFTAKAAENRGTDIVLDPSDPQFLTKLANLGGDEKNYPAWWEGYYETLAAQTQREAESAATKEVVSPGLKSGRDLINGQITKTMASIFNVQEAAISGVLELGTSNSDNPISQIVAGVVSGLVNKFVFTPIGAGTGGGIGVIGGQNVCIRTPQMKPISAIPEGGYDTVPSTPPIVPPTNTTPPFTPR